MTGGVGYKVNIYPPIFAIAKGGVSRHKYTHHTHTPLISSAFRDRCHSGRAVSVLIKQEIRGKRARSAGLGLNMLGREGA